MSDQTFYYTEEKALTANAFTLTSYSFARWTTNADGTGDSYTDGQSVSNLTATNGTVIDLYAKWLGTYKLKRVADTTDFVNFIGTTSPVAFAAGTAHHDVLFLGGGCKLYYPDGTAATTIGACRAFFQLNGITAGEASSEAGEGVRAFVLNYGDGSEETGIVSVSKESRSQGVADAWYALDGRMVGGVGEGTVPARLPKGVYILNGRRVVIE